MLIHGKVGGKLPRGKLWWVEREREDGGGGAAFMESFVGSIHPSLVEYSLLIRIPLTSVVR